MSEPPAESAGKRNELQEVERRQWFAVSSAQLQRRGFSRQAIKRDVDAGRLFVVHHRVYSTIQPELLPIEGRLAAAILAGGKGALLCAPTAAWWLRLISSMPQLIHVAARHARKPANGIRWHELTLRPGETGKFKRMPITSPARTALDVAPYLSLWELKGVLAELEYRFGIGPADMAGIPRRGHPGSRKLRRAIKEHTPQLAATRTELEREFLRLLAEYGFPLPEFNHPLGLSTVDAVFRDYRLVVELDGVRGHSGERRILRDHRRDLHRRADGFLVLRYHFTQLIHDRDLVAADLERAGLPRELAAA